MTSILVSKPKLGIVIPSAARHDILPFVNRLDKTLRLFDVEPQFHVMVSPTAPPEAVAKLKQFLPNVQIHVGSGPVSLRVIEGLDKASSGTQSALVICDDFDHLVSSIGYFSLGLLASPGSVIPASWDAHSLSYIPYSMALNEKATSISVSFAGLRHFASIAPSPQDFDGFSAQALDLGTYVQVYTGLFGLDSAAWPDVRSAIYSLVQDRREQLHQVGFEAILPLVGDWMGLDVKNIPVAKRFEHSIDVQPGSDAEVQFALSRLSQFQSGQAVVGEIIERTNQQDKIQVQQLFSEQMSALIKQAPFHHPGHPNWPLASEWNTQIRTTF